MAINVAKDSQLSMNQNLQREFSKVVESETTYTLKITKERVDELIKEIDKLMNGASL